jgi:hypothetical protein
MAPVLKNAGETPRPKMLEEVQERMHALIAQHDSVLATLTTLRQHLKAQQNDEQTNFWKILFQILMFQQNSIKAHQNLHMNVAIA